MEEIEESELVRIITQACRNADEWFDKTGGGTRHWARDCFLPALRQLGYTIVKEDNGTT